MMEALGSRETWNQRYSMPGEPESGGSAVLGPCR